MGREQRGLRFSPDCVLGAFIPQEQPLGGFFEPMLGSHPTQEPWHWAGELLAIIFVPWLSGLGHEAQRKEFGAQHLPMPASPAEGPSRLNPPTPARAALVPPAGCQASQSCQPTPGKALRAVVGHQARTQRGASGRDWEQHRGREYLVWGVLEAKTPALKSGRLQQGPLQEWELMFYFMNDFRERGEIKKYFYKKKSLPHVSQETEFLLLRFVGKQTQKNGHI